MKIKFMEAINYVPYESDLENIRSIAEGDSSMRWLDWTSNAGLPWLPDGGKYKDLNIHRFEIRQEDVNECALRVHDCVRKLTQESE
jgi:hypothetical protein